MGEGERRIKIAAENRGLPELLSMLGLSRRPPVINANLVLGLQKKKRVVVVGNRLEEGNEELRVGFACSLACFRRKDWALPNEQK